MSYSSSIPPTDRFVGVSLGEKHIGNAISEYLTRHPELAPVGGSGEYFCRLNSYNTSAFAGSEPSFSAHISQERTPAQIYVDILGFYIKNCNEKEIDSHIKNFYSLARYGITLDSFQIFKQVCEEDLERILKKG